MSENTYGFNIVWDDLSEEQVKPVEMTYEQFKNEFGFDAAEIVDEFTPCADPMLNNLASGQPLINDQSFETNETPNSSLESPLVQNEFKDINVSDVQQFIKNEENKNTAKKTLNDTNKFKRFLASRGEYREMHHIEVDVLDDYISTFILSLQKSNCTEYEPTSIRGILGSLDRKLKRHRFPYSIMAGSGPQFSLTRQTYNAKKKSLKKQVIHNAINVQTKNCGYPHSNFQDFFQLALQYCNPSKKSNIP